MCRGEHCSPVEYTLINTLFGKRKKLPYSSEFVQVLSTGERCSPLQIIRERFYCRKIATLFAGAFMIIEKKRCEFYFSTPL